MLGFRFFQTAIRLGIGAIRLPHALYRAQNAAPKIVSVDVFATLLARLSDDNAAWRDGAFRLLELAREYGLVTVADPIKLRIMAERQLSDNLRAIGRDPEFSHREALLQMLHLLGAGDWAERVANDVAA